MAPDRWAEVERIYHEVLEHEALEQGALEPDPGKRAAFLDEACGGDEALRREVQSLLGYAQASDTFLERPALEDEAEELRQEPGPPLVQRQIDEYRILSLLGEGGMGQVYRAKDLTLGREVAIKVLHGLAAGGPGNLRRFEEEARLASVLNHPNIVTIYGVGEKSDLAYIAMELVHGRTLREMLSGDPLSLKVSLDLAAQLAGALSVAHARGIVHRDLKPENIMVTREGRLKVLDFGIAKLHGPRDPATEPRPGSVVHTEDGSILGTVGYMSPEQAAGKRAVPASDQFSLGTILYEMVTGRRAWKRSTAAETLTAIIREDPAPIASAAPGTPKSLRWIIERCLAKDPEDRYGSTRDLARDLATLRDHFAELSGADLTAESAGGPPPKRRGWAAPFIAVASAAVLGAVILLSPLFRKPPLADWVQIGFRRGVVWSGRFAPDGQTIVYSAAWDGEPPRLFSTRPGSTETRTLDLPPGRLLAISSRSELAFLRNLRLGSKLVHPGTLVRAGLEGGVGRDVLENVLAADWSPDGTQLAVAREVAGKVRLEYPIGKTLYETETGGEIWNLRFSPDGAWIAFYEPTGSGTVLAVRVADGLRRVLSDGWFMSAFPLAWSPDGREVWFTPQKQIRDRSPALMAATLTGQLREVTRGPGQLRLFDIAPNGRLLIARWDVHLGLRGFSSFSGRERELSATDDSVLADLTGDGRNVLIFDRQALFLRPTDGSPPLRLGEGLQDARLSPDGKWVLAGSKEGRVLVPVGAGDVRRVAAADECHQTEWLPDGTQFVCERLSHPGIRLSLIEVASGKQTDVAVPAAAVTDFEDGGPVSADGAFLAGSGSRGDVWVLPLAGGEPRRLPTEKGMIPVGWSATGRYLYVERVGSMPANIQKLDLRTGRAETWRDLSLEDPAGIARIHPVMVKDDGRSWAFSYLRILSNLYVVDGLK